MESFLPVRVCTFFFTIACCAFGQANSPIATLNPTSVDFGGQFIGTSSSRTVTLSNTGSGTLTISGIATAPAYLSGIFSETNSCGTSLEPGAQCTVTVTFTPSSFPAYGELLITDSASSYAQSVGLNGYGETSPEPLLSPLELSFGNQALGDRSAPLSFTVTNTTYYALTGIHFTVSGTNAAEFYPTTTCGTVLRQGATCTLSVTLNAAAVGARVAVLTFTDDAPDSQTVQLTGTGIVPQVKVFIDAPQAQSGPVLGTASFSGWAIDNDAAITGVQILIDGGPVGTANYGTSRPDVCAAFTGQIGCPNVGWTFSYDTTRMANGQHTLEVTGTSATGQHASVSSTFTVANWSGASSDPIRITIDKPSGGSSAFAGTATFSGWAIDNVAAISSIAVAIDGVSRGSAVYGGSRSDVCAALGASPGCPNVGWSVGVDTTALTDGPHTLEVTATSNGGEHTTVRAPFTVANLSSQTPIHIVVDTPNGQSGPLSGGAHFGGWAVDDNNVAITGVSVLVDGVFFGNAQYGGNRPDVCTALPGRVGCPAVGWDLLVDTTLLGNGPHGLEVTAVAGDGTRATIGTSFTVGNAAMSNPTRVFVDVPSGQAPVLLGVTTISGWAINDSAAISSVAIFVDGNAYGNANYGTSRPDVCNAFPSGVGCPGVGWNLLLDTTALANGTHTLTVSALAANAQHNVLSTTFTVANWTAAGNPFRVFIDVPNATSAPLTGIGALIGGWAMNDNAAIASIAVGVDGVPAGSATYGGSRNDVCAALPGRAGCPNVGWTFLLDSTALADGAHTLDVTATSVQGQSYTTSSSFRVGNLGTPSGIRVQIDIPSIWSAPFSGAAAFGGWALSDNETAITTVAVSVDGVLAGNALYGGSRTDVCAALPNRPGCPNVGWTFVLDTTQYANGSHTLDVTAMDANGKRATQSAVVVVTN